MENENYEQEIDLLELLRLLLNRWYLVLASVLVVFGLTTFYAVVLLDDTYTTESSVLVDVAGEEQADSGDILLAQRLLDTYTEVAESNRVINQLKEDLNLSYSNTTIRDMITISRGRGDSIVLKFSVTSTDAALASAMANGLVNIVQDIASDSSILHHMEILDTAQTPSLPSGPNRLLYMSIGLILGVMIGAFAVFLIEFFDKSIKTSKDIENKLELRVLGVIPEYVIDEVVEEV